MKPLTTRPFAPLASFLIALILLIGLATSVHAQKPINYQGRVTVRGVNFDGTGQFKFASLDNITLATASVASTECLPLARQPP